METILLVVHLILALSLVGVILMQRSEGGALGIGGGGGGGGLMSARGAANLLTKTTVWLAVGFLATSMALALLARQNTGTNSVMEQAAEEAPAAGEDTPGDEEPEVPVRN